MDDFDFDGIILTVFGIIVAMAIFFGFITAVKKAFNAVPTVDNTDSSRAVREQRLRMEDIRSQHDKVILDKKQAIEDGQNLQRSKGTSPQDVQRQQREMMENLNQRMQDLNR